MYAPNTLTSLSPEDLRTFIVLRLKEALPGHALAPKRGEPYQLTLSHPVAGDLVLNLGNLVREVRQATPSAAEEIVDRFVSLARRAMEPPAIDLAKVYPGLRHHAFLTAAGQRRSDAMIGDGPGDLATVVLSDQGDGLATLNESAVRNAGHTPEAVLEAAERNFVKLLPEAFAAVQTTERLVSVGLKGFPWLGTSLLFVPSLISRVMEEKGWTKVLLAAPSRETIDFTDASERDAASVMRDWMAEMLAGPRTQSELVYSYCLDDTEYRKSFRMLDGQLIRLN